MTLVVRRVAADSASEVLHVIRTSFAARPVLDPPADALAETEESVAAELRAYGGLLATLDGAPVGTLLFRPSGLPDDDAMMLRRFGVVPAAQGKGVAQKLVQGAADATLGYATLVVLAREELPATVGFWARRGFAQTERRSPYVEMRRTLPTSWRADDAEEMRALGSGSVAPCMPATSWCSPASSVQARPP